jgi:hypothetical protein
MIFLNKGEQFLGDTNKACPGHNPGAPQAKSQLELTRCAGKHPVHILWMGVL